MIEKDEIEAFMKALSSLRIDGNGKKESNESYLRLKKEVLEKEASYYSLDLIGKQSLKDLLLSEYKSYDICLNKKQYQRFVKNCESIIKQ